MNSRDSERRKKTRKRPLDPKQKRQRRTILWSSIGAAIIVIGGITYATLAKSGDSGFNAFIQKHKVNEKGVSPTADQNRFTALLIGTDTRPGETGGNTDVLMVMSIDYKTKTIQLLSVPRDTMVTLPGGITGKINSAYDIRGVELTDQIVQNLLNVNIPNYAITHFGGLVDIINTIGGIWVNVPEPMHYDTGDKIYGIINLNPGYQKLTGPQALGFVRFREDPLGDIGRTERQQSFLKALEHALMKPGTLLKLPQLVSEFSNTIDTNLSKTEELSFASQANQFKGFKIISMTLPGAYYTSNGLSYWLVNPKEASWNAHRFFYQGIVVPKSNTIQTVDYVNNWTPPAPVQSSNATSNAIGSGASAGSNSTASNSSS